MDYITALKMQDLPHHRSRLSI